MFGRDERLLIDSLKLPICSREIWNKEKHFEGQRQDTAPDGILFSLEYLYCILTQYYYADFGDQALCMYTPIDSLLCISFRRPSTIHMTNRPMHPEHSQTLSKPAPKTPNIINHCTSTQPSQHPPISTSLINP